MMLNLIFDSHFFRGDHDPPICPEDRNPLPEDGGVSLLKTYIYIPTDLSRPYSVQFTIFAGLSQCPQLVQQYLGLLHMSPVNRARSVSEILSRHSFLRKVSMCSYEKPG